MKAIARYILRHWESVWSTTAFFLCMAGMILGASEPMNPAEFDMKAYIIKTIIAVILMLLAYCATRIAQE